jgi:hypothetical protein
MIEISSNSTIIAVSTTYFVKRIDIFYFRTSSFIKISQRMFSLSLCASVAEFIQYLLLTKGVD